MGRIAEYPRQRNQASMVVSRVGFANEEARRQVDHGSNRRRIATSNLCLTRGPRVAARLRARPEIAK